MSCINQKNASIACKDMIFYVHFQYYFNKIKDSAYKKSIILSIMN